MSDPLRDELEQERREREWAETWKPDPGEMLVGTLEGYDEAATDYGEYTVAHVRDEEGVLRGLWLMHSVLQDEWKEASPEIGERVGIQYLGQREGKDHSYHMWVVKVDRSDAGTGEEEDAGGSGPAREQGSAERQRPARPSGGEEKPPSFEGDELYDAPPSRREDEPTGRGPHEGDGGEPTFDDPNEELPF